MHGSIRARDLLNLWTLRSFSAKLWQRQYRHKIILHSFKLLRENYNSLNSSNLGNFQFKWNNEGKNLRGIFATSVKRGMRKRENSSPYICNFGKMLHDEILSRGYAEDGREMYQKFWWKWQDDDGNHDVQKAKGLTRYFSELFTTTMFSATKPCGECCGAC